MNMETWSPPKIEDRDDSLEMVEPTEAEIMSEEERMKKNAEEHLAMAREYVLKLDEASKSLDNETEIEEMKLQMGALKTIIEGEVVLAKDGENKDKLEKAIKLLENNL